jgi:A/G-specific adenine glycosylase
LSATSDLHAPILGWYDVHQRDLPWRDPDCSAWHVLVSEIMLQQTPVNRVLPVWREWVSRWPTPKDLAAEPTGEAIRAWGRLGYPRRALRLHAAATAIATEHANQVPRTHADLLALPGIGSYTAAAVASFAFGQRHAVLDTNVRRVFARVAGGTQYPSASVTVAETRLARSLLPAEAATAARWAVAVMELGALICTARSPTCDACPVRQQCTWRNAGYPAHDGPPRRGQAWTGTDRQVRGAIVAALRTHPRLDQAQLSSAVTQEIGTPKEGQFARCLDGLVADGLVEPLDDGFRLPG